MCCDQKGLTPAAFDGVDFFLGSADFAASRDILALQIRRIRIIRNAKASASRACTAARRRAFIVFSQVAAGRAALLAAERENSGGPEQIRPRGEYF